MRLPVTEVVKTVLLAKDEEGACLSEHAIAEDSEEGRKEEKVSERRERLRAKESARTLAT